MKTVTVNTSKQYNVCIGRDLHRQLGELLLQLKKSGKVAVISDSNVWPLYGSVIEESLINAGFRVCHYLFPAGEQSKNGNTYLSILNFLAEEKLTRTDCVIALGGGVVGDMTGFVAATYLRGIAYIQVPTSLLAMVDSSVGGKTAIDLPTGKNLVGAFYQPDLVLCDIDALNTLPAKIFRDGCAEVIKYGVLYDAPLFEHLHKYGLDFDQETVIARCVELKRDVVAQDEFDTGARQKLNLGHTIGHSIEALSDFTVTHGEAVAIGMAIVSKAAVAFGECDQHTYGQILSALQRFTLPTDTKYTVEEIYATALSDKKRAGGSVNLIVPRSVGDCVIRHTAIADLKMFIKAGL